MFLSLTILRKEGQMSEIKDIIRKITEELIFLEQEDLQALAQLHGDLEEISDFAESNQKENIRISAAKCADLIESIILGESEDIGATLELVGRIVGVLQFVIVEGMDFTEIDVPDELGLNIERVPIETEVVDHTGEESKETFKLPANVDETIFSDFLARQDSVMDEFESLILSVENEITDDNMEELKRLIHTLKGESGLLGLDPVQAVCHNIEDLMGKHDIGLLIDLLLEVKDWLSDAFAIYSGKRGGAVTEMKLVKKMLFFRPPEDYDQQVEKHQSTKEEHKEIKEDSLEVSDFGVEMDPELIGEFINESLDHLDNCDVHLLNIESDPSNMDSLNAVFRAFHTIKGSSGFMGLKTIASLAHESENLLDKGRKGEIELVDEAIDVTFESVDALKELISDLKNSVDLGTGPQGIDKYKGLVYRIKSINEGRKPTPSQIIHITDGPQKKIGEILVEDSVVTREDVEGALNEQRRRRDDSKIGQILVEQKKAPAKDVALALRKQKAQVSSKSVTVKETVKVDAERLDRLVDTIGELVIAESMVSQSEELIGVASANMQRHMNQLDSITRELQEMATSLRMVPVAGTFHKMARLVRDLSKQINKKVNFVMTGENTELDKTVVDKIGDPLIHMIRNAVDHGIEDDKEARLLAGKSPIGRIELRAFHKGGNIFIEIEDDGKGLDKEVIRAKAIERGMISADTQLSDKEIYNLIFEPGFSTAKKVTNVSGRGVGMDVVKKNIQVLRGKVEISSQPGKGSTFSIKLPLTLAIIDGMIIRIGNERYILPTLSIVRSLKPSDEDLTRVLSQGEMLTNQGHLIPVFRLNHLFDLNFGEEDPTKGIVIIIENDGKQTGIVVDEILNQQQIVIKSLGANFRNIKGISGGTIMADGTVGLILDVGGIVNLAIGTYESAA